MSPNSLNNSAETVGNHQDLLTQILVRLPTKPLLKFKCVSKQWLSLISNPHFCLSHTRHQRRDPTALLLKLDFICSNSFNVVPLKHYSEVPFFGYIDRTNVSVVQSCNGLFLLSESLRPNADGRMFFICNPTTKKFKKLSFPKNSIKNCCFEVSLAFDPMKSPHYKIIVVRGVSESSNELEIDIYASETDHWKVSQIAFKADAAEITFHEALYCNGKIHWNSYLQESLYFDVENDRLQKMPMPATPEDDEYIRYLGEINGSLHLAWTYYDFDDMELDIYQMASDYSHWFFKCSLDLNDAMGVFPELNLGCDPILPGPGVSGISFVGSEEQDEAKIVMWADGKIICYNFICGEWEMIYDPGTGLKVGATVPETLKYLHLLRFRAFKYFENLSCV